MADRTTSSIHIDAPPAAVLDVIADFEAYPQWAKEMSDVTVLAEDGDGWADRVQFTIDSAGLQDTYSLDYDWDVVEDGTGVVSWTLVEATMLKAMDGSYTLVEADGGTDVTYQLGVDVKLPMISALKRKAEKKIIDTALKSLKARAEG